VFAKNEYIQECLINEMKNNLFSKEYIAILNGLLKEKKGTINLNIARKENSIIERCIEPSGETAITHFELIRTINSLSVVKFKLETGRTHQIRVHSKAIGSPILGDSLYGKESDLISRQALHAYRIKFIHPITKTNLEITAPIPEDMKKILDLNIIE
jgi:23S rRNA pseudouridine1911/1915/1917 synthase